MVVTQGFTTGEVGVAVPEQAHFARGETTAMAPEQGSVKEEVGDDVAPPAYEVAVGAGDRSHR